MSRMTESYKQDTSLHVSPYELAVSLEEEQKIYDTPCDDDDCGPIYCEPPTEEEKLYAVFEGKKLQKLCHKDIRYATIVARCSKNTKLYMCIYIYMHTHGLLTM